MVEKSIKDLKETIDTVSLKENVIFLNINKSIIESKELRDKYLNSGYKLMKYFREIIFKRATYNFKKFI